MSPMPENVSLDLDKWLESTGLARPASDGALTKDQLEAQVLSWAEAAAGLDGLTLLKVEAMLSRLGCRAAFVRRWSAEVKRMQKEARKTAAAKRLDGYSPYRVEDGYLVYMTEVGERRVVADFVPQVVGQTVDERGHRSYIVEAGTVDGRTFRMEISAQTLANNQELVAAFYEADGGITIFPGQEPRLRAAITQFRIEGAPETQVYNRTGWLEDGQAFLIPGLEPPGVRLELPSQLPFALPESADLTSGLDALEGLLRAFPPEMTTIPLALLFGMPLAQPAGWRKNRYGVFVTGPTGSLKTAWCTTAMCLYGDFRDTSSVLKWGQGFTLNAALQLASHCHDLVLPVDNYKPTTGDGEQGLVSFAHAVFEGSVKLRLNRDSSFRNTPPIHCGVLINGEDAPHSDAATLARFLVVPITWPAGENNVQLARAQSNALHLPAVMRSYILWLQTDRGRIAAKWAAQQYEPLRDRWRQSIHSFEKNAANAGRLASNLALNQISLLVASEHPALGPVLKPYIFDHQRGLAGTGSEMARSVKELREAARVLAALREMVASGRAQLAPKGSALNDRPERMLGWKDDATGNLYLLPGAARRLAEEYMGRGSLGEISDQKLHKQLCEMGLLASHEEGRYSMRILGARQAVGACTASKQQRVFGVRRRVLTTLTTFFADSKRPRSKIHTRPVCMCEKSAVKVY